MSEMPIIASVLSHYPGVVARHVEPLGAAGGFSGAALWRIKTDDAQLCLRRWPQEHPSHSQLQWIHKVLCYAAANGFVKLPTPFRSRDGQTSVSVAGHFWELTRWLPGRANFHERPNFDRLDAALVALAQFHRSSEPFESRIGTPPGIASRREQLEQLCTSGASEMSRALSTCGWREFQQRAASILHWFNEQSNGIKHSLDMASRVQVPLQPCIRDIWHDHVLFEDDEVSGFVDFGAMRTDHVACDISRLLGSLIGSERAKWEQGLTKYQSLRPLTADELVLVDAYDQSTVLLSGMNWVQWIAVEDRKFDDRQRVLKRLDEIIRRLQQM
jgi:Ser/Thr protein kinase RdoA (MazF antagonist)